MSDAPKPAGRIHDLGYPRYLGTRREARTRWRVIARNQISFAWKTWWRFKSALGFAVITTFVAGGIMYIVSDEIVRSMVGKSGSLTFANATLPGAIEWYSRVGFLVSLTIGARVVSGDIQSGAFTFYFARSVRPRDYVIGKLVGLGFVMFVVVGAGPILLAFLRLGLSSSTDAFVDSLPIVGKAIIVAALSTLAYAAVPLGFSAMVANQRYSMALWAAYYLVIGSMARGMAEVFESPSIAAIDLPAAIQSAAYQLFEVTLLRAEHANAKLSVALASIFLHVGISLTVVWYRLRASQTGGVGGAS